MPQGQRQYGQVFLAFFFSSSTYQPSYKHLEGLPYFWIGIEKKVSDVLVDIRFMKIGYYLSNTSKKYFKSERKSDIGGCVGQKWPPKIEYHMWMPLFLINIH